MNPKDNAQNQFIRNYKSSSEFTEQRKREDGNRGVRSFQGEPTRNNKVLSSKIQSNLHTHTNKEEMRQNNRKEKHKINKGANNIENFEKINRKKESMMIPTYNYLWTSSDHQPSIYKSENSPFNTCLDDGIKVRNPPKNKIAEVIHNNEDTHTALLYNNMYNKANSINKQNYHHDNRSHTRYVYPSNVEYSRVTPLINIESISELNHYEIHNYSPFLKSTSLRKNEHGKITHIDSINRDNMLQISSEMRKDNHPRSTVTNKKPHISMPPLRINQESHKYTSKNPNQNNILYRNHKDSFALNNKYSNVYDSSSHDSFKYNINNLNRSNNIKNYTNLNYNINYYEKNSGNFNTKYVNNSNYVGTNNKKKNFIPSSYTSTEPNHIQDSFKTPIKYYRRKSKSNSHTINNADRSNKEHPQISYKMSHPSGTNVALNKKDLHNSYHGNVPFQNKNRGLFQSSYLAESYPELEPSSNPYLDYGIMQTSQLKSTQVTYSKLLDKQPSLNPFSPYFNKTTSGIFDNCFYAKNVNMKETNNIRDQSNRPCLKGDKPIATVMKKKKSRRSLCSTFLFDSNSLGDSYNTNNAQKCSAPPFSLMCRSKSVQPVNRLKETTEEGKDSGYFIDLLIKGEEEAKTIIEKAYENKRKLKKLMEEQIEDEIKIFTHMENIKYEKNCESIENEIKIHEQKMENKLHIANKDIQKTYLRINDMVRYIMNKIINVDLTMENHQLKYVLPIHRVIKIHEERERQRKNAQPLKKKDTLIIDEYGNTSILHYNEYTQEESIRKNGSFWTRPRKTESFSKFI